MTEAEWLACDDPTPMINFLRGKLDRKLRLVFCASARAVWSLFDRPQLKQAVEAGERLADGLASSDEIIAIRRSLCPGAHFVGGNLESAAYGAVADGFPVWTVNAATDLLMGEVFKKAWEEGRRNVPPQTKKLIQREQGKILHCVMGNPFRPITFDPAGLPSDALSLAQAAYEERTLPSGELQPARLAVLSDALEEAGCTDDAILSHLRSPGPHVRGCWALDLILGKQ